eukprot:gene24046-27205_t
MNAKTVHLLKDDFPEYLRSSPYLQSLIAGEDFPATGIEVPADCIKADTHVSNAADLLCLLKTVRYWLVPELLFDLEEVHVFAFDPKNEADVLDIFNSFETDLPHVNTLLPFVSGGMTEKLNFAASRGFLSLLDVLCQLVDSSENNDKSVDWQNVLYSAAKEGQVSSLEFLRAKGNSWGAGVLCAAAEYGRVDCLVYIQSTSGPQDHKIQPHQLFAAAAKGGQVLMLQYLLEKFGLSPKKDHQHAVWCNAAAGGHLETMNFLHEQKFACRSASVFEAAAGGGQVAALEFLIKLVGIPDEDDAQIVWIKAAEAGHLHVMQFLHRHVFPGNFPQNENEDEEEPNNELIAAAVASGSIPCVVFLRELGHPWEESFTVSAANAGNIDLFRFLVENGCPCSSTRCAHKVAAMGSLESLVLISKLGLPWDSHTCDAAADEGHVECLKFLMENGCPVRYDNICASAAANMSCLTYAHEHGGKLTVLAAIKAAHAGALDCLQYLHAHGCTFNILVTNACAQSNLSPACLQFVLDTGCAMTEETCKLAATRHSMGRLKGPPEQHVNLAGLHYAIEQGCPWGEKTRLAARHQPIADYLESIIRPMRPNVE